MSEVTRYFTSGTLPSCPATRKLYSCATDYVLASDYDTALSQLAALREELAQRAGSIGALTGERDELQQRLADAERRNSSLEALLKECNDCVRYGEDFDLPVTTMARIDAALNKPEEAKS